MTVAPHLALPQQSAGPLVRLAVSASVALSAGQAVPEHALQVPNSGEAKLAAHSDLLLAHGA
jgi:hypothetical protein